MEGTFSVDSSQRTLGLSLTRQGAEVIQVPEIELPLSTDGVESIDMEIDSLNNLNLALIRPNGDRLTDSISLNSISGVLVIGGIDKPMATAILNIVKTATNQQVYNGEVTTEPIPTGAGTIRVTIAQFGETLVKEVTVSGETLLDISEDVITISVPENDSYNWTIEGTPIPVKGPINAIRGPNSTKQITASWGYWGDGTEMAWTGSYIFSSDFTIEEFHSSVKFITESGNFIVPVTSKYQIVLVGGGGGGGGGAGGYSYGSGVTYSGFGGDGGNGGYIRAVEVDLIKDESVLVTIGAGGRGGIVGDDLPDQNGLIVDEKVCGTNGSKGGTTIFGSYSAEGGTGGTRGDFNPKSGYNGNGGGGGNGSNGKNMDIFGVSKSYGRRGIGGVGNYYNAQPESVRTLGTDGSSGIDWLSNVGNGGDGGNAGMQNYNYVRGGSGGSGGYGYNTYGIGGMGGNGTTAQLGPHFNTISGTNGKDGTSGAVAMRTVIS